MAKQTKKLVFELWRRSTKKNRWEFVEAFYNTMDAGKKASRLRSRWAIFAVWIPKYLRLPMHMHDTLSDEQVKRMVTKKPRTRGEPASKLVGRQTFPLGRSSQNFHIASIYQMR